jgi:hypothetical protein
LGRIPQLEKSTIPWTEPYTWRRTLYLGKNSIPGEEPFTWGRTPYLRKNSIPEEELYTWGRTLYLGKNSIPREELYTWGRTLYLGKNGDTLQVDGEGPEDLHGGELVVEHQGEQRARTQQEFDPECTKKSRVP